MTTQISVILPSYKNPTEIINSAFLVNEYLAQNFDDYEIIIVEDGIVGNQKIIEKNLPPNTRVISYQENKGKGYAVRQGLLAATGQIRAFCDSDLPYDLSFFKEAYRLITTLDYELVAGDRAHPQSELLTKKHLKEKFALSYLEGSSIPWFWGVCLIHSVELKLLARS